MIHLNRRRFLATGGAIALYGAAWWPETTRARQDASPVDIVDSLVIDMSGDPDSIDPAIAYSARDWSIVHAIHDGLVTISQDGTIVPLAAERFEAVDEATFEATIREGLTFHDGSPVTADAAIRGIEHLQRGDSLVIDLFSTVADVERVDDLTLRIVCSEPSPWLPAQLAVWHMMLPESADTDSLANAPVGCGPYRFTSWEMGSELRLERFEGYQPIEAKGAALADTVAYRFVPEASTRVADLLSGASDIITELPLDQWSVVENGGGTVVSEPVVGSQWIRIATDTPPFDDPSVRQALNLSLDVDALAQVFVGEEAQRLASIHPDERSLGFDPDLGPYEYDPDRARSLLEEAGLADGLETTIEITTAASQTMVEAIVAQWAEAGIHASIEVSEYAAFNANWTDPDAPALKMSTWSPLYDPHTLLNLVFAGEGYLSRYDNPEANELITMAAEEPDLRTRAGQYRDLAGVMNEDAAAVYLWNLVAGYGVSDKAESWKPRGDEYVLPLG